MSKMSKEEYVKNLTGKEMPVEKKEEKDKKILCIMGTAGSRNKAPYNDPRCEFWGVAHCLLLKDIPKLDKVFEIHLPYIYDKEISPYTNKPIIHHVNKENSPEWREKKDVIAILPKEDKNINKYEVFERARLKEKYRDILPVSDAFYATNSIAWMLLLALDEIIENDKYDEVHLYGIHLETDTEWQYERPCNEWWLGIIAGYLLAHGKKNVIHIPEESDVLRGYHEYGFADIEVRRKKILGKKEFYENSLRDMNNQMIIMQNELEKMRRDRNISLDHKIKWAKDQIEFLNKEIEKYNSIEDKSLYEKEIHDTLDNKINAISTDIRKLENRMSAFNGAKDQVDYFLKELNA
jgi:hypothetical protein